MYLCSVYVESAIDLVMKKLTEKQLKIYKFIDSHTKDAGFPPTYAEICGHFSFKSLNAVRSHLNLIEKKGYIRLGCGKARGIQLIHESKPMSKVRKDSIPVLGTIAAGVPVWAEQNFDNFLPIAPDFFGGGELFALRVIGESMIGAGIRNYDIAIIQKQSYVENGTIAAVLIEQEATLKRVYLSPKSILLKSDNPDFNDIEYCAENTNYISILGKYMGVIRSEKNRCSS